jgi:carboxymethylenebutenolidase
MWKGQDMSHEQISIRTRDGDCPAHVFKPEGPGPWPAAIFYMDGLGIRPTLFDMGQRLADGGYVVLLPDLFYRAGPYAPLEPKKVFASGDVMAAIGHLFSSTNNRLAAEDSEAFLAYLDTRDDVAGNKIGTTGYCMGGAISLTVAGTYPDRIAAAASFHGGNLATDSELSPHLLAPRMKGRIYVAGADKDNSYPLEMAERLEKALSDAGVDHRCEIYPGALHGWTMADFPVYDEPAADRHWRELQELFASGLR